MHQILLRTSIPSPIPHIQPSSYSFHSTRLAPLYLLHPLDTRIDSIPLPTGSSTLLACIKTFFEMVCSLNYPECFLSVQLFPYILFCSAIPLPNLILQLSSFGPFLGKSALAFYHTLKLFLQFPFSLFPFNWNFPKSMKKKWINKIILEK